MQIIATEDVAWSVCVLFMTMSPAKIVELIEMLFEGPHICVGAGNHILNGGLDSPMAMDTLGGMYLASPGQ